MYLFLYLGSGSSCQDCLCNNFDSTFGFTIDHNLTSEELWEKIHIDLMAEEDISSGLIKIQDNMKNASGKYSVSDFLDANSKEWLALENIDTLLKVVPKIPLKMPINFSRTLMEQLIHRPELLTSKYVWKQVELDELFNFFSFERDNNLNLIAISHLYTMNDFGQMSRPDLFDFQNNLYLGRMPKKFKKCFKQMCNELININDEIVDNSYERIQQASISSSPCSNLTNESHCQAYCQWHKTFFSQKIITRQEFMTLMKYSLPQRKLLLPPINEVEWKLTQKVFTNSKTSSNTEKVHNTHIASMPLIIFCKDRFDQKWLGDDIGVPSKFCADFYSTPTDQGICLVKNLNFQNLVDTTEEFQKSFDKNNDEYPMKIQGDILNAEATFIINTNAKHPVTKTFLRSKKFTRHISPIYTKFVRKNEMEKVDFQINSPKELPHIYMDSSQGKSMHSLTLKSGHEYFIELTPVGQTVTNQFKAISFEERRCLLPEEVPELSTLKIYTKQNCRYECKVIHAMEKCGCIPWDFPINITNPPIECDVFGRTCFLNAIKYVPNEKESCKHCQDECEFIEFRKTKIIEKKLDEYDYKKIYNWFENPGFEKQCQARDFCEYLHDTNDTIDPKTWYEKLIDNEFGKWSKPKIKAAATLLTDHTIVHINFESPKVEFNVLDARYTLYDKISNLGGTIGLCEQVTGASFLTLIHLVVLIFKSIFKCCTNYLH